MIMEGGGPPWYDDVYFYYNIPVNGALTISVGSPINSVMYEAYAGLPPPKAYGHWG